MIDMVNELSIFYLYYLPVHFNIHSLFIFSYECDALSVKFASMSAGVPFMCIYPLIVFWVNYGEFTLCQGNPPKRISVAEPAI